MPRKPTISNPTKDTHDQLVGVDEELSLYDLTDLFQGYYRYHNEDCLVEYAQITGIDKNGAPREQQATLSRFEALRRIEAARLGGRPYFGGVGITPTKPNTNNGYMNLLLTYLTLPYQSIFSDGAFCKIQVNKKLYESSKLSGEEKEKQKILSKSNPNLSSNQEISDDISDCYRDVLKVSRDVRKCHDFIPLQYAQNGAVALLHSDIGRKVEPIALLDLLSEPQATYDVGSWSNFFIIRKMTAHEVVSHIREPGAFWNKDALKWALENSFDNRGLLNSRHYRAHGLLEGKPTQTATENFSVKSFYKEKKIRATNLSGYYGNLLVVEGYYINTKGKVTKVIFFPSNTCASIPYSQRFKKDMMSREEKKEQRKLGIEKADVLYKRDIDSTSLSDFLTIIPFNRGELSLERQRAYGHELFNPVETVMRADSCVLNTLHMLSVLFTKDQNRGNDSSDVEEIEIKFNGESVDMGDREIIETPFQADLKGQLATRQIYLQHAMSKAFLGGLDGTETVTSGRGANMANLRLVRDGRVHKHSANALTTGLTDFYTKHFNSVLEIMNNPVETEDDVAVNRLFKDMLIDGFGYNEKIFEINKKDIIPDTGLPFWMRVEAVKSGASEFGAAEMVLYSEIKQIFGDGLDKPALDALNRMGIKSLLGTQDAFDILGDPKEKVYADEDQMYFASNEQAALLGSVSEGTLSFESAPIRASKDDPITHLIKVHNPKAQEIIKQINDAEFASSELEAETEQELETRVNLILKLAALANHISLHQNQLRFFGDNRDDINRLREETNAILQSAEGLLNNLQGNLRALQALRQDQQARLQNLSPENEAEKLKHEKDLQDLSFKREDAQRKLLLANKIADQRQAQHVDKQLTKARDRASKEKLSQREMALKMIEMTQAKNEEGSQSSGNVNGSYTQ